MRRLLFRISLAIIATVGAGQAGAASAAPNRIPGVFDPKTKTFTAIPWWSSQPRYATPSASTSSPAPTTTPAVSRGTIKVTFSLTLNPAVPPGAITAMVFVDTLDSANPATGTTYTSSSNGFITLTRTGTTATGSISVPFAATVNSSTYVMQVAAYYISSNGTNSPQANFQQTITVPANGSTTPITIKGYL